MCCFNSSTPITAYVRQWNGSALVQVTACRPFSAKALPESILTYCQLDLLWQTSVEFESEFKKIIHENAFKNIVCQMFGHFSRIEQIITFIPGFIHRVCAYLYFLVALYQSFFPNASEFLPCPWSRTLSTISMKQPGEYEWINNINGLTMHILLDILNMKPIH